MKYNVERISAAISLYTFFFIYIGTVIITDEYGQNELSLLTVGRAWADSLVREMAETRRKS